MIRLIQPAAAAALLCLTAAASLTAPAAHAASDGAAPVPLVLARSDAFTGQLVARLESGITQCQALPAVYRPDCYRQNYRATGRMLNGKPDYRDAQRALKRVETALTKIMRRNTDKATPPITRNGQTFKPITEAALKPAAAAFDQARAEAVTILLRSGGAMRTHNARIAAVVGSNKVLLRAALEPALRALL